MDRAAFRIAMASNIDILLTVLTKREIVSNLFYMYNKAQKKTFTFEE